MAAGGAKKEETLSTLQSNALVINGHGSKSDQKFVLKNHTLLTPGDLNSSYVFNINANWNIEKSFRSGALKPFKFGAQEGKWKVYSQAISSSPIPDVIISPWAGKEEAKKFANRILTEINLWTDVDGKKGLYANRDPNAKLVLRKPNGTYVYVSANEASDVYKRIVSGNFKPNVEGEPIFYYAPAVGKVKILNDTKLSEISHCIHAMDGNKLLMLATCNASQNNVEVKLDHLGPDISLKQVLESQIGKKPMGIHSLYDNSHHYDQKSKLAFSKPPQVMTQNQLSGLEIVAKNLNPISIEERREKFNPATGESSGPLKSVMLKFKSEKEMQQFISQNTGYPNLINGSGVAVDKSYFVNLDPTALSKVKKLKDILDRFPNIPTQTTEAHLSALSQLTASYPNVRFEERLSHFDPKTKIASGPLSLITIKFQNESDMVKFIEKTPSLKDMNQGQGKAIDGTYFVHLNAEKLKSLGNAMEHPKTDSPHHKL